MEIRDPLLSGLRAAQRETRFQSPLWTACSDEASIHGLSGEAGPRTLKQALCLL